ncbi:MAG: hypothetical protein AAGB01_11420 [Cyanobacteria bacterium P01_F01_bin.42]
MFSSGQSSPMALEYITLSLPGPPLDCDAVESRLQQWGHPVRWAVTRVENNHCEVEAVVCQSHSCK